MRREKRLWPPSTWTLCPWRCRMNNSEGQAGVNLKITTRFKTTSTSRCRIKTRFLSTKNLPRYLVIASSSQRLALVVLNLWQGPRCMKRTGKPSPKPSSDRITSTKGIAAVEFHKAQSFPRATQTCITRRMTTKIHTTTLNNQGPRVAANFRNSSNKLLLTVCLTTSVPADVTSHRSLAIISRLKI